MPHAQMSDAPPNSDATFLGAVETCVHETAAKLLGATSLPRRP